MCAIAIARPGATVTVLEAASQPGELAQAYRWCTIPSTGVEKTIGEEYSFIGEPPARRREEAGTHADEAWEETLGYPWCLGAALDQRLGLISDAVKVYEKGRMPMASYKQQVSHLNGWLGQLPDNGPAAQARNRMMQAELKGEVLKRSANLCGDPVTVLECYGYDAESHAKEEIEQSDIETRRAADSGWVASQQDLQLDASRRFQMQDSVAIIAHVESDSCLPRDGRIPTSTRKASFGGLCTLEGTVWVMEHQREG